MARGAERMAYAIMNIFAMRFALCSMPNEEDDFDKMRLSDKYNNIMLNCRNEIIQDFKREKGKGQRGISNNAA